MPQNINTNIMSLTAQRNLNSTQNALSTAMQRLSSGLRINSAKDDAAGLAIATRMTTQVNGFTVAERNANDGVSMAQTAGSALTQITNDLQTIRQLAVQSANATNSASDRQALNAEAQQEVSEITRIARQTTFNGSHILDGSLGQAVFQVGADVGQTVSVDFSKAAQADQIGKVATASSDLSNAFSSGISVSGSTSGAGALTVAVGSGTATAVAAGTYTSASDLATAINTAATASNGGTAVTIAAVSGNVLTITGPTGDAITIGGGLQSTLGLPSSVAAGASGSGTDLTSALAANGGSVTLGSGDFSIQSGDNTAVDITGTVSSAQDLVALINAKGIPGVSAYVDSSGALQIASQQALTIDGNKAGTGSGNLGFTGTGTATAVGGDLASISIASVDGANDAITRIGAAIQSISSFQSELGATQNRFDSVISNLQSASENTSAARSRIQDADFAQETAALSRAQILQQAGVSMLAQANAQPQLALKLLQ
jgi:flagellin